MDSFGVPRCSFLTNLSFILSISSLIPVPCYPSFPCTPLSSFCPIRSLSNFSSCIAFQIILSKPVLVLLPFKFFTFMGPCIANISQYMSNKMQLYTVYLYMGTALHVSGVTSTHHQEHVQLYLQRSSTSSTIAAGSSNRVTSTRCCRYSCMRS